MNIMIKRDRLFSDKQCQRVRSAYQLYTPDLSTCTLRIFKKDSFDLRSFLGLFSGRRTPLRSDHATVRTYDQVYRLPCRWKQQTEIDVSGSRCLAATMRSSVHCMPLVGQIRRSACDIVGPRATARNATHTKTSQRNKAYTSLFFWYYINNK